MQRNRWRRSIAASTVALALVATACSSDDASEDPSESPSEDMSDDMSEDPTDGMGGDLAAVPGFDGETIRLGVITPTTGLVAVIGNPLTAGNQARVDAINAAGGIAGMYPIELVVEDSAYDAPTAVQKYTSLKSDVVMFAQILGTPIVNALAGELANDGMLAQPASLDSFWVRNDNLLPVGAPYQVQAINALDWWVNQQGNGDTTICWAGHDDPYGEAGLEGVQFAAEQMGFELAAEVAFSAADTTPESQAPNVGRLAEAGCEFVFLTSLPSNAGGLLGAAAGAEFAPVWIANSPTWVNALAASPLAPYLSATFHVMADGAEWGDTSVPGMAQMIDDIAASSAPDQAADQYFTFGYAAMLAVEQVLEAAVANGDLGHDGILAASQGLDVIEFQGLFGDYQWGAAADRVPPRNSRVFGIDTDAPEVGYFVPVSDVFTSDAAEAFEF